MKEFAVLTGDLIGSTSLDAEEVERRLLSIKSALDEWYDGDPSHCFTRQSGDGWQAIVKNPKEALRVALFIKAWLKSKGPERTTRIFIADGKSDIPESKNLNDATGDVFVLSGRGLNELPKRAELGHASGGATAALVRLADHISQDWTETQAKVMRESLHPWATQTQIAKEQGVSQQSVQQTQTAAGHHALKEALSFIEGNAQ